MIVSKQTYHSFTVLPRSYISHWWLRAKMSTNTLVIISQWLKCCRRYGNWDNGMHCHEVGCMSSTHWELVMPYGITELHQHGFPGGGVLPMWWVIHMCRGFDPLFSLWQDRARSFWGIFSHPPTPKRSFGVLKLPILTEFDLLGPKFHFSLNLFGSNFQRPAAHPHHFSDRVPPPGMGSDDGLLPDGTRQLSEPMLTNRLVAFI